MTSLQHFVCEHPYFSMLVFVAIGFLLRGIRRLNPKSVRIALTELELALDDEDMERAKHVLQRLKSGFGL
ncbi:MULTISPECIES: hypothetical protein [unclassified Legionella]|uniref:hypothetical protein n=1 Tax=unclassified Legionella TaxID=2622702 RepID=UPI001E29C51B|nr:hypothetical protein [Legionella sp. 31fI33]MCC5013565.1 hypothetical protein [Legionella sp. 31fI33]